MTTDHRDEFKAQLEAAMKTDEGHLVIFRHQLALTQARLFREQDSDILQKQVAMLQSLISSSEAKLASLRDTLDNLMGKP
jgi:hypothetical protein